MDFIPFARPAIGREEEEAALRVLRSGWLTTGAETQAFEREFAAFLGADGGRTLAVNSATSGLLLALDALGVSGENAVVTTPYTFVSTALAALHLGARVYYGDIEEDSFNIDPAAVEAALNAHPEIRAVIPVHVGGNVCKMDEIGAIAARRNAAVVEDAAHAFPARTGAGFAGTLGDAGVFSFYATKTITTGEGGMAVFKDPQGARRAEVMRLHGIDRPVWNRYGAARASWEYDVVEPGWKCNLPDILSAIGREQLKKANLLYGERKKIAGEYTRAFEDWDFLTLPPDSGANAWHLYVIGIRADKLRIGRDAFARLLQDAGIGVSMHFIPHFRFTWFKKNLGLREEDFPRAAQRADSSISLPLWPGMTGEMVQRVIESVGRIGTEQYARKR
ncbi:MAG: DegT/DnrJ/EryC1/StrS family aminotransferase [Spirochaetaceae bacterium]|jgi:dTDP-4-amino-4,6-dideoxygalactose transaminase|nr:DegT/DnrJ/EryC1/StrS family aminotransferase [Spirochaetaceae bacterium]